MPSQAELAAQLSLDGLSEQQLETFWLRAVPEPGGALRAWADLTSHTRQDIPSTIICRGIPSERIKAAVAEGLPWTGGLAELRDITYVDLPTSHRPMWSRPKELAGIISDVAIAHAPRREHQSGSGPDAGDVCAGDGRR